MRNCCVGSDDWVQKKWEEAVSATTTKLAKCKWLLSRVLYRMQTLIINGPVASALWHRLVVLNPPAGLLREIQRQLLNFFWLGHHWLKAAVLNLPVQEVGGFGEQGGSLQNAGGAQTAVPDKRVLGGPGTGFVVEIWWFGAGLSVFINGPGGPQPLRTVSFLWRSTEGQESALPVLRGGGGGWSHGHGGRRSPSSKTHCCSWAASTQSL